MKIYSEKSMRDFEFWSGAIHNAEKLTLDELDEVGAIIEDIYPDGIDETALNDIMWFDFATVCEWLGYEYDVDSDEIKR